MELPDKNTDLSDSMEHSQLITTIYNSFNQLPVEDAILILDDIRRKLNCETSAWDVKMDVATFKGDSLENEDIILNSIKSECRKMQVTTTEELKVTKKKVPIVELDAFIYDDINDIETDNDKYLSIYYYCKSCSSRDIGFTKLVSHSMSAHRVKTLFRNYLPQVYSEEKGTLIDIGSRYGVVLYGAALYGLGFQQIIGIEIDEMFCNIQRKIVQEYGFDETIQIHHGDLLQCPSMISQAQVLILNNVFEYFCSASEQNKCWEFLKENCSVGCILVLVPSIQVIWKRLRQSGKKLFHWKQWVEECTVEHVDCAEDNQPETEDSLSQRCTNDNEEIQKSQLRKCNYMENELSTTLLLPKECEIDLTSDSSGYVLNINDVFKYRIGKFFSKLCEFIIPTHYYKTQVLQPRVTSTIINVNYVERSVRSI